MSVLNKSDFTIKEISLQKIKDMYMQSLFNSGNRHTYTAYSVTVKNSSTLTCITSEGNHWYGEILMCVLGFKYNEWAHVPSLFDGISYFLDNKDEWYSRLG